MEEKTKEIQPKKPKKKGIGMVIKLFFIFLLVMSVFSVPTGIYQVWMWDVKIKNIRADLKGEQEKCINVLEKNDDNLRDLINYERAGADKITLQITPKCFKLINNYDVVEELTLRKFVVGNIISHIFFGVLGIIAVVIYLLVFATKIINKENEEKDEQTYY